MHVPSALHQANFDHDIAVSPGSAPFVISAFSFLLLVRKDNESHFHEALNDWRQLNLSSVFIKFANDADPLSASMALLLHNWRGIVDLWNAALDDSDDEALKAMLEFVLATI